MKAERKDWLNAAIRLFREGGTGSVSIEALSRSLGVSKGSFYWYFANREELLEDLLCEWEAETEHLIEMAGVESNPLRRVLGFFEQVALAKGQLPDIEFLAWARRDKAVANRAAALEDRRIAFIHDNLMAAGVPSAEAVRRAEAGYLATLGWIDRSSRRQDSADEFRTFVRQLFRSLFKDVMRDSSAKRAASRVANAAYK